MYHKKIGPNRDNFKAITSNLNNKNTAKTILSPCFLNKNENKKFHKTIIDELIKAWEILF